MDVTPGRERERRLWAHADLADLEQILQELDTTGSRMLMAVLDTEATDPPS